MSDGGCERNNASVENIDKRQEGERLHKRSPTFTRAANAPCGEVATFAQAQLEISEANAPRRGVTSDVVSVDCEMNRMFRTARNDKKILFALQDC